MDHAVIAIFALLLNLCLGGPRALYLAAGLSRLGRIPAKLLRDAQQRFNEPGGSVLFMAYGLLAALFLGVLLQLVFRHNLRFAEVLLVATLLPAREPIDRLWQIHSSLARGDIASARRALEGTVLRHHVLLDAHGAVRAGIEFSAVQFTEKILLPLLWYLLLGLPGLLLCKMSTLMKEQLPASFDAEKNIGRLTLGLFGLSSWVASRFASVLWLAAALFLSAPAPAKLLRALAEKSTVLAPLPYTLFTAATVLNVSLGGPQSAYINDQWFGLGTAKAEQEEARKSLFAFALLCLFLIILLGLFL